ncbi:MAG: hypothetical protein EPN93_04650 [Spirochaetes bacterium]|nr:MAG: hypothetical protein EPN93_04650 [Spirochaetota bacterium]
MRNAYIAALITLLALVPACSDTNTARVTIVIGDLATAKAETPSIIDRFLMLFGTRAEAVSAPPWPSTHLDSDIDITLTIEAPDIETITAHIPTDTSTFTTELPAGAARKLTVVSMTKSSYSTNPDYENFGGMSVIDLSPGDDVTVHITMIPITRIQAAYGIVTAEWDAVTQTGVTGYDMYISTSIDGPYTFVGHTAGAISTFGSFPVSLINGTTYYVRIVVTSTNGDGLPSEPFAFVYVS